MGDGFIARSAIVNGDLSQLALTISLCQPVELGR